MAKTKVSEWDAVPGNNTDIDSINIAEGCAPSGINNAIRELMSQVKDFQQGTYSDPFNGPVNGTIGATTPAAGSFTTLTASSTATLNTLASSGATLTGGSINNMAIGGSTAAAGAFTTLSASGAVTLSGGTANGVAYLNGSKVLTTGSALTFDGTTFNVSATYTQIKQTATGSDALLDMYGQSATTGAQIRAFGSDGSAQYLIFKNGNTDAMRLTSTGLGIGTSSPTTTYSKVVQINGDSNAGLRITTGGYTSGYDMVVGSDGTTYLLNRNNTPLTFGTNGSERMRLDSSGNLGIGTSSPSRQLDVKKTAIFDSNGDGTTTNPSIAIGSTSVGFSYLGGSQLAFITNSAEKMRLDSSGNLGIGTSSPAAKLDVQGASSDQIRVRTAGTEFYRFGRNSSTGLLDFYGSQTGYQGYTFGGVDGTWMTLNSSGNLGLGVTPSAWSGSFYKAIEGGDSNNQGAVAFRTDTNGVELYANGFFNGTNNVYKYNGAAGLYQNTAGIHAWFTAPSGTAGNAISFTQAMTLDASGNLALGGASSFLKFSSSMYVGVGSGLSGAYTTNDMAVWNGGTGNLVLVNNGSERARIDSSGNVGIGTSSPGYKLDVNGTFGLGTGQTGNIGVFGANTSTADTYFRIRNSAGAFDVGTASTGHYFYGQGSLPLQFFTDSTERARISSSGNFGIGISNPTSLLHVGGDIVSQLGTTKTYMGVTSGAGYIQAYDTSSTNAPLAFYIGNTERARFDTSGNLLLGTTSSDARLYVKGSGSTSSTFSLIVRNSAGGDLVKTRDDGYIYLPSTYNNTSASAANIFMGGSGELYRSTSSLKYKTNVQDAVHGLSDLLKLRSVTYEGKSETDAGKTFGGLIAEEVHDAGLTEFVQYAEDGSPDALAYGNMVSLCIKAIQEQQTIINQLKARLDAANL